MAANPRDLTTVADVIGYINFAQTPSIDEQALIQRLVTAASDFIQTHLNRAFNSASYTEYRNGTGGVTLVFSDYPVTAVSSVTIDGQVVALSADRIAPGYVFSDSVLYLVGGLKFTKGIQNVKVVYTAGYAEIPFDIAQVTIDLVGRKYKERKRIGLVSENIGQQTITYAKTDLTDEFKSLLRQYQKVTPI